MEGRGGSGGATSGRITVAPDRIASDWTARKLVIRRAVIELLLAIGEDTSREGLSGTPDRVARFWEEFIAYEAGEVDVRFESVRADQLVILKGMDLWSLCEHHLLPFTMTVSVGYLTREHVVGLSKLARVAHREAHKLQVQERYTAQLAGSVCAITKSTDVAVIVRGVHTCMTLRGVRTDGEMVTSEMLGAFREKPELRAEFLALVR